MTNVQRMTKFPNGQLARVCHWTLGIGHSLVIGHWSFVIDPRHSFRPSISRHDFEISAPEIFLAAYSFTLSKTISPNKSGR